jgi:hypothetical protein
MRHLSSSILFACISTSRQQLFYDGHVVASGGMMKGLQKEHQFWNLRCTDYCQANLPSAKRLFEGHRFAIGVKVDVNFSGQARQVADFRHRA